MFINTVTVPKATRDGNAIMFVVKATTYGMSTIDHSWLFQATVKKRSLDVVLASAMSLYKALEEVRENKRYIHRWEFDKMVTDSRIFL